IGINVFFRGNGSQLANNLVELNCMKTEVLAARADGLRNVLCLSSGHHENDVRRGLFQGLEQCIERGISDLMRFVKNINLKAITRLTITRSTPQLTDLINTAV